MGMVEVTMLNSRGIGKLELFPSLEVESTSLADSSRMACSDGDPLWAMPTNRAPESFPLGNRLWSSEGSVMNMRPLKRIASPWVCLAPNR
jgi:hypothetical protein